MKIPKVSFPWPLGVSLGTEMQWFEAFKTRNNASFVYGLLVPPRLLLNLEQGLEKGGVAPDEETICYKCPQQTNFFQS